MTTKRYRGFISYSQHDRPLASRVQKWLETYRVPIGIDADVDAKRMLGRFCRDEADMAATSDIGETVRRSIAESEGLIIICSPRAAQSKWVEAEIEYFRVTHGNRNVFAYIVEGTPNSGDPATECFPPALRADTSSATNTRMPTEPFGPNLRTEGWHRANVRLAAGLLGVEFDDLWQRSRRRLVRQRAMFAGGALALAVIVALLATIAIRNQTDSVVRRAELLVRESEAASEAGDHLEALQLAIAGYRSIDRAGLGPLGKVPFSEQGIAALEHAYTDNLASKVLRHSGPVSHVVLSDDGSQIAAAAGSTVNVWRLGDPRLVASFTGYNTRVSSMAFSPDGKLLAVADVGSVSLRAARAGSEPQWRASFGVVDSLTAVNGNPTTVQFSPRGDYLMAFADRDVSLWRVDAKIELYRTLHAPANINRAIITPDGGLAFFRLSGGDGAFWEIGPQRTRVVAAGKTTVMGLAALSNDGHILTSDGPVVSYWEVHADSPRTSVDTRGGAITALAFSPDSLFFATGSSEGLVQLWLPGRKTEVARFVGHASRISSLAFSANGRRLLTGSTDGTVRLWRTNSSEPTRHLKSAGVRALSVAFSADGKKALTGAFTGSARVWSTSDGTLLADVQIPRVDSTLPDMSQLPQEMLDITVAEALELGQEQMPNPQFGGEFAAMLKSLPGTMTLRQLVAIAKNLPRQREAPPIVVVAFAPDGKTFLTGSWDQTARIWSIDGGTSLRTIPIDSGSFTSGSFSPDGTTILTTSASGVAVAVAHLRNLTGEDRATFTGHERSLRASVISPDGKWIATGSQDKTARLYGIEGGHSVQTFSGQTDAITGIDFSPDGKRLLTGSQDGSVWLWEIGKSSLLQMWRVSERNVESVTFFPSGELFLTSAADGAAKIWRIGASIPVQTFHHRANLFEADVSPDGQQVLTGGGDGYGKLWAVDPILFSPVKVKVRLACQRLEEIGVLESKDLCGT